jgi:hypothetical protein
MKLGFSQQTSEKSSNVKFYEHLSSGIRVVQCGQTEAQKDGRHGKANTRFRNFANALKNWLLEKGKH